MCGRAYHVTQRRCPGRQTGTAEEALQEAQDEEPYKASANRGYDRQDNVHCECDDVDGVPANMRNLTQRREEERAGAI